MIRRILILLALLLLMAAALELTPEEQLVQTEIQRIMDETTRKMTEYKARHDELVREVKRMEERHARTKDIADYLRR